MRICTLISSYENSSSPYRDIDPYPDPSIWLPEHSWSKAFLTKDNVESQLSELAKQGFDLFINLCDGEPGEDLVGIEAIQQLERLGLPFTGANSQFYANPRRALKDAYVAAGIGTPHYRFVRTRDEAAEAAAALRLPVIVKPAHGYASIGIKRDSVVQTHNTLLDRVERTVAEFGEALLEEFIVGREFTLLAAEPIGEDEMPTVYKSMEIGFPAGESFKHFELKWVEYNSIRLHPVEDTELDMRLRELAARTFKKIHASGYVRFDIRMDAEGELYVLDCNTNPGLFYPIGQFGNADLILEAEPDGHKHFLRHIIASGLHRAQSHLNSSLSRQADESAA